MAGDERRLLANAMASMANVVVGSALLFVLYRLLLHRLGPETLGVWSLLIASVSAARLSELGMAAGATRFVAAARATGDDRQAVQVAETATLTLLAFGAVGAAAAQLVLPHVLERLLPAAQLAHALQALPWALGAFVLGMAAGAPQSALDGCQRVDLRVWISLAGQAVLLAGSALLVEERGIAGVAIAQALQSLVMLAGSWVLLRGQLHGLPMLPARWSHATWRRMLGYSALFQLNHLLLLLLDPLAKILLTRLGGLSSTAYFDMANLLVQRLRMLPVAATQVLIPAMAQAGVEGRDAVRQLYDRSYRTILATAVPSFCLAAILVPSISVLWIGHEEPLFMGMAWICMAGWALSTIGAPAYFSNIGTGTIGSNSIGHILTTVLAFVLGWWGGTFWGAYGVSAGYIAGIATGALYVQIAFLQRLHLEPATLVPDESRRLLMLSLLAVPLCLAADALLLRSPAFRDQGLIAGASRIVVLITAFSVIVGTAAWSHPLRRSMTGRVLELVRRQPTPS